MKKRVIVFDFDGTIADSKELYVKVIHDSLVKASFIFPRSRIVRAMGPKLEGTLKNLRKFDKKTLRALSREINGWVVSEAEKLRVCPQVKSSLARLKNSGRFRIILLTNSVRHFPMCWLVHAFYILKRVMLGLVDERGYISVTVADDGLTFGKPLVDVTLLDVVSFAHE